MVFILGNSSIPEFFHRRQAEYVSCPQGTQSISAPKSEKSAKNSHILYLLHARVRLSNGGMLQVWMLVSHNMCSCAINIKAENWFCPDCSI